MVRNNDYPKKNFQKDGVQASVPPHQNSQSKPFQKPGEGYHRENNNRNGNRPPREAQQRDNNQQKEHLQRENQKRENTQRENQQRAASQKENQRDNQYRENQHRENVGQRNHHKDTPRENREPFRSNYQRPVIKPRADETVEDIALDIIRIEKEIQLELKEIKSMRLGV